MESVNKQEQICFCKPAEIACFKLLYEQVPFIFAGIKKVGAFRLAMFSF